MRMVGGPFKTVLLAAGAVAVWAASTPVGGADVDRGRLLYENHCQSCHGLSVHNRQRRWSTDLQQLRGVVDLWQQRQNLGWSREDIDDVVFYLNVRRYNY